MRIIEFSQRVKLTSRGDEIIISRLLGSFNIAVVLGVASEMRTRRDRGSRPCVPLWFLSGC